MESLYAIYDGEKFVTIQEIHLNKGQKLSLTILEEEILPAVESKYMYATAIKSRALNYLPEEREKDFSQLKLH